MPNALAQPRICRSEAEANTSAGAPSRYVAALEHADTKKKKTENQQDEP
jgi:hypothetical protein